MTSPWDISESALVEEVLAYRKARAERLTAEKGWLSLVNKVWLHEGKQTIGSAEGSEISLAPDRAPPRLGTVTRRGRTVQFEAEEGVVVRCRGEIVRSMLLRSDAESDPDELIYGSLFIELIDRGGDLAIRVRDPKSKARLAFRGLPAYSVDASFRIVARFDAYSAEKEVILEDGDGKPQRYLAPGAAYFEKDGLVCRLEPVLESDRKRLFVLFSDPTNRDETYGAGRFLYAPLPEGGRLLLDFNKAFNPPCAFTPYATCPLPSPDNRLPLRVTAGEKRPEE